ncbi:UNVERIFIED_CONTAM: hypothetical protein H355_005934 [Colinus virginianus]|nr:hypothetical protein H355_005934 [Colinus virginianus]
MTDGTSSQRTAGCKPIPHLLLGGAICTVFHSSNFECLTMLFIYLLVGQHWCYLSQKKEQPDCEDPRHWHTVNANCRGSKQSPINIVTKNVIYDQNLKPLYFEGYDVKESSPWKIENNGHTGKYCQICYRELICELFFNTFTWTAGSNSTAADSQNTWYEKPHLNFRVNFNLSGVSMYDENTVETIYSFSPVKVTLSMSPKIGGGGLNGKYKAVEFHLHWGTQEEPLYFPGSEHSIDGEKQAMELHIVHIREDALDLADAKNYPDGIAVLAFFIKIDKENRNYATLIGELGNIPIKDTSSVMEPLPLSSLLPPVYELRKYYRYDGSLTTPDCHETVIWTVFEKPITLSLLQVSQFSTVHFGGTNSTLMSENFRPAQFLNGRFVYWSGASSLLPPAKVLVLLLILPYILNYLFQ